VISSQAGMFDPEALITDRLKAMDASGIRRVFDLAAELENPVNLSIGQPDFDVPEPVKQAAVEAIQQGQNHYTPTQGIGPLREALAERVARKFPATFADGDGHFSDDAGLLVTSGVSGGLMLSLLTCAGPGDEVLIPDPYFVTYKHLVTLAGATPVYVDTYPDFEITAARVEAKLTERSKILLFNSPSNPTGTVASWAHCRALADLAEQHGLLLISDEIYDAFCYEPSSPPGGGEPRLPSPAMFSRQVLVLRGFSKTYAMTGWRLGYAAGPQPIVDQMTKLQQYSFVCAPAMVQRAGLAALETDVGEHVRQYRAKRDRVLEQLGSVYSIPTPGGAFYVFAEVPSELGLSGQQFIERAIGRGLLIIPGGVFSERDTHFRLSYACDDATLDRGLEMLVDLGLGA